MVPSGSTEATKPGQREGGCHEHDGGLDDDRRPRTGLPVCTQSDGNSRNERGQEERADFGGWQHGVCLYRAWLTTLSPWAAALEFPLDQISSLATCV